MRAVTPRFSAEVSTSSTNRIHRIEGSIPLNREIRRSPPHGPGVVEMTVPGQEIWRRPSSVRETVGRLTWRSV